MKPDDLSTCFCTQKIDACRDFYTRHFGATLEFDCGWYISLLLGDGGLSIQFMSPQEEGMLEYQGGGVTLNLKVGDVDSEYQKLKGAGLAEIMPLEDHPWGDRAFAVSDPIGVTLYIYSDREPSEEFKQYFKD